jgi:glycosyltransferase involved in cell wall biosynthesis
MNIRQKHILISIYNHPEAYPPTLNAIAILAQEYDAITVLCNNFMQSQWNYPENCKLQPIGEFTSAQDFGKLPLIKRIKRWLSYTYTLRKLIKEHDVFIAYDSFPLVSYYLAQFFLIKKPKVVWYHNHDVMEKKRIKKFTLNWLVSQLEPRAFSQIDIFSLPAIERKKYFPIDQLKGQFFFIPNYPSAQYFKKVSMQEKEVPVQLIFQGTLSEGHGFEELIDVLPCSINGHSVHLKLMGPVKSEYQAKLEAQVKSRNAEPYVTFLGRRPYRDVPVISSKCHIGIAIFTKTDIMNSTLGTASNKIYEYASVGLPVLYFDNQHFKQHLKQFPWAIPTDLSKDSLLSALQYIMDHYEELSSAARNTFLQETNFEKAFGEVSDHLHSLL